MKTLTIRVRDARKALKTNRKWQSKSLTDKDAPISLDISSFIDLLNAGGTRLEFVKIIDCGTRICYEYSAVYSKKNIVTVSERILYSF